MCRFFNQICENKLEIAENFEICEIFSLLLFSIHYYSLFFIRVLTHANQDEGADGGEEDPDLVRMELSAVEALDGLEIPHRVADQEERPEQDRPNGDPLLNAWAPQKMLTVVFVCLYDPCQICQMLAKFARFRLYWYQFLEVDTSHSMRFAAFF